MKSCGSEMKSLEALTGGQREGLSENIRGSNASQTHGTSSPSLSPLVSFLLAFVGSAHAQTLPAFDFTQPAGKLGWIAAHDISRLDATTNGLVVTISGPDPYLTGPPRDYPVNQPLWLRLRLKSDQAGTCQGFYYRSTPTEPASVRFTVPAGRWVEGRVPMSALGPNYRMRIDPPGTGGQVTLASLRFEARASLPDFDFATIPDANQWGSPHDLQIQTPILEGLPLVITGGDPYFFGPPRDYPSGQLLWMRLRLKSGQSGMAQLFYFQTGPTEENSVRFYVPGGDWVDLRVPVPALWPATRLRIDPPGTGGTCLLGRLNFELRPVIQEPVWPKPEPPVIAADALGVASGELSLVHNRNALGAFDVRVSGQGVAAGNTRSLLGYTSGNSLRWLTLTNPAAVELAGESLRVRSNFPDPDGGQWQIEQTFSPSAKPGGIDVETRVTVGQDRSAVFLPMLTLLPGVGTFGTNKTQALLAGVEYLENEPSSSEADVIGSASRRQVPDSLKLTFPLMTLAANGRYVGLMWEPQPHFAALHDSPDRIFNSGGHVMALVFPGSDPSMRDDGRVLPYAGQTLRAGQSLVLRATILGGSGDTVVPAVQQFVARRGWPALPDAGYTATDYFTLAAHGWLDSQIRDGFKFRHAVGANFGSAAVADAPLFMDWLAGKEADATLASRLTNVARSALSLVAPQNYNSAAVGHIRHPVEALVYGAVAENAATALAEGRAQLGVFQPDGSVLYQPPASGTDLGRTHWARDASGLTATHVVIVLERGVFSGDRALMGEGLRLLRALNKFRQTVPRGAQTWEVPLHTPDILASARLVRAYTLGYELTGETDFLEQARYWAWTGVPFVYLAPPNDQPVGAYSAIPVFGATQFVAPVWIGLPVQWCGLVYGDAIRRLGRYDLNGPWRQLANGIAAAGVQHTHTAAEPKYQGLLPDSFDLRVQARNPVPINPATLLAEALQLFGEPPVYDWRAFLHHGLLAHSPGPITDVKEGSDRVSFRVDGWPRPPWRVLVNGFTQKPRVRLDGVEVSLTSPHQFQNAEGRLILQLKAPATVELVVPAKDAVRIRRSATDTNLRISWPLATTDYMLERALALSEAPVWQKVSGQIGIEGSERALYTTPAQSSEFFRLRRQP